MTTWSSNTAVAYSKAGSQQHVTIFSPVIREWLGDLNDRTALDFGCGPGHFARLLAACGATRVRGIDESPEMIQDARIATSAHLPLADSRFHFSIGDENALQDEGQFNAVLCSLTLMMCETRERLDRTAAGLVGALSSRGRLVVIVTHPCFRQEPYVTFRYQLPDDYNYWQSGTDYQVMLQPQDKQFACPVITDHHWTLTDYANAFTTANGQIHGIRELPAEYDADGEPVGPPAYLAMLIQRAT